MEPYEQLHVLGEGGFGEVWKCKQNDNGNIVAIKYLKNCSPENLNQFRREIECLHKEYKNQFIVDIYDHNLSGSSPYFVMEFCELGSIQNYAGNFSPKDIANLLLMMVKALKAIHNKGGFHRDIKPQNILLKQTENEWIAKLSDFGLARIPNPNSQMTQTPCGTVKYMAPEIKRGEKYTSAADIYSLGLTCYELLTKTTEPSVLNPKIPTNLWQLLRDMTWEDPTFRVNLNKIEIEIHKISREWNTPIWGTFSSMSWAEIGLLSALGITIAACALEE